MIYSYDYISICAIFKNPYKYVYSMSNSVTSKSIYRYSLYRHVCIFYRRDTIQY